jgi:5-methyltetrahydropteroyltriglutamate--homocysteine methyltransferase
MRAWKCLETTMSARTRPPFRADQVGSLIRPQHLIEAREKFAKGEITKDELLAIQHPAIRTVVKMQEDIGLKSVTDGEFNRTSWQSDFLLKIKNVGRVPSRLKVRFHSQEGTRDHHPPTLAVQGKISRPEPMFVDDLRFLASITKQTPKVTMPSPTILHFRGGRGAIDEAAYPNMDDFFADLAKVYQDELAGLYEVGGRYAQIDETNLAYLCDPNLRKEAESFGEDPNALPKTYANLINACVEKVPQDMTICMHLCRGNFAGAWIAEGGYEPVADLLFNEVNVTGYFLEYDSERAGGFEPLRFLPKGKVAVLGLVTTKNSTLEIKDDIKRRIEQAAKFVDIDQLALSPQCGFSSGIGGETMTVEQEMAKLRLVVEIAEDVWGSA